MAWFAGRRRAAPGAKRAAGTSGRGQAALLLAAVLLMAGCLTGLWRLRQDALAAEEEHLRRLSLTLAEHTSLAFREIDVVLRETRPLLPPELLHRPGEPLHKLLRERYKSLRQGQALLVFDAHGRTLGHSRLFPAPDVHVADRDYFRAQVAGGDALFISAPLQNRVNGRWMISLSRRLAGPDGAFAGVIMAAVDMAYFSELYQALDLPDQARLLLCRDDGVVLLAHPFDATLLGHPAEALRSGGGEVGAALAVPGEPLEIRLSTPSAAALRRWRWHAFAAGSGMLAIAAGVAAAGMARREHLRELRRRTELLQRSEQALRASEARYRSIVETANEGICILDESGRITYANRVLAAMLGSGVDSLLGRPVADLLLPGTAWPEAVPNQFEARFAASNGAPVDVLVSVACHVAEGGQPAGCIAMLTDITRRKEEERFREGIESVLRHDLRSTLVNLSYIPRLLQDGGDLNPQQTVAVEALGTYVRRMLRMVDAYLDLSRIEKDTFRLERRPVALAPLLLEVAQELEPLRRGGERGLVLRLDGGPLAGAAPVFLSGHEVLCHTLLANLVKNALEASPERGLVEVDAQRDGGELVIAIANQGAVPEEIRGRFFQKYATAGKRQGTGLGAYSARLIAQAHGGSVELDSATPGRTVVRARLPLHPEQHEAGTPA